MSRPWPFPAGAAHREAAPDPMDASRESLLDDIAEAAAQRRAARAYCAECRQTGGHADGCPAADDYEEDESDSPYCECDNEPTMNEEFSRKCSHCGKTLIS